MTLALTQNHGPVLLLLLELKLLHLKLHLQHLILSHHIVHWSLCVWCQFVLFLVCFVLKKFSIFAGCLNFWSGLLACSFPLEMLLMHHFLFEFQLFKLLFLGLFLSCFPCRTFFFFFPLVSSTSLIFRLFILFVLYCWGWIFFAVKLSELLILLDDWANFFQLLLACIRDRLRALLNTRHFRGLISTPRGILYLVKFTDDFLKLCRWVIYSICCGRFRLKHFMRCNSFGETLLLWYFYYFLRFHSRLDAWIRKVKKRISWIYNFDLLLRFFLLWRWLFAKCRFWVLLLNNSDAWILLPNELGCFLFLEHF